MFKLIVLGLLVLIAGCGSQMVVCDDFDPATLRVEGCVDDSCYAAQTAFIDIQPVDDARGWTAIFYSHIIARTGNNSYGNEYEISIPVDGPGLEFKSLDVSKVKISTYYEKQELPAPTGTVTITVIP